MTEFVRCDRCGNFVDECETREDRWAAEICPDCWDLEDDDWEAGEYND